MDGARPGKISPTLILCSPFARAIETAEIAAAATGYTGKIVRTDALVPEASPHGVWLEIRNRQDETQILLAGHEPLLGQLAAYLLNSPALYLEMRKATLVRIDFERFPVDPHGILKWMIPPEIWIV
jgi:phosphohistidine phosphatase SixA